MEALGGKNKATYRLRPDWVIRFRPELIPLLRRALPVLGTKLSPIKVPELDPRAADHGIMLYPWIKGEFATDEMLRSSEERISSYLALIKTLHAIAPMSNDLPERSLTDSRIENLLKCMRGWATNLQDNPLFPMPRDLEALCSAYLKAPNLRPSDDRPVLVHMDLATSNVLWQEGTSRISGIIDWDDLAMGDPAHDYAPLFRHIGEHHFRNALTSRGLLSGESQQILIQRCRFLGVRAGLETAVKGIEDKDKEKWDSGLSMLGISLEPRS